MSVANTEVIVVWAAVIATSFAFAVIPSPPITLTVVEPPKRTKGIMVKDVEELVQKLKNEAKVI